MDASEIDLRPLRWILRSQRLRALRRSLNVSQEAAADAAGVTRETWVDWDGSARARERGRIPDERIYDAAIGRFAATYKVDPSLVLSENSAQQIEPASPLAVGFGVTVAIRSWRGAMAAASPDDECPFDREPDPYEVPSAFLVGGPERAELHDVVKVSGSSLEDRVMSGERILFYRDATIYRDSIVFAASPDGRLFMKVIRKAGGTYHLASLKDGAATFTDLDGWTIYGYAVAIIGDPEAGTRNIEWANGRPLKA